MTEIWKQSNIKNIEISNFGRVRKNFGRKTRIIYQGKTKDGYKTFQVMENGKRKTYKVHRIVATCFIDNKDKKPVVNHIDGNKKNNNVENLEWVTTRENEIHKVKFLFPKTIKFNQETIIAIINMWNSGISQTKIAKIFGISQSMVSLVINKKRRVWV